MKLCRNSAMRPPIDCLSKFVYNARRLNNEILTKCISADTNGLIIFSFRFRSTGQRNRLTGREKIEVGVCA